MIKDETGKEDRKRTEDEKETLETWERRTLVIYNRLGKVINPKFVTGFLLGSAKPTFLWCPEDLMIGFKNDQIMPRNRVRLILIGEKKTRF